VKTYISISPLPCKNVQSVPHYHSLRLKQVKGGLVWFVKMEDDIRLKEAGQMAQNTKERIKETKDDGWCTWG